MVYDPHRHKIYWSNSGTHELYSVDNFTGTVSKLAGMYNTPGYANTGHEDDPVTGGGDPFAVSFNGPGGLALTSNGKFLIIADTGNNQIRGINMETMNVSLVAGSMNGTAGSADGVGTAARFNLPVALASTWDNATCYISEIGGHTIRAYDAATGTVRTIAGLSGTSGLTDAIGTAARFFEPVGMAVARDSRWLYVADRGNNCIRAIDLASQSVVTIAGDTGGSSGVVDGQGTAARFDAPSGLVMSETPIEYSGATQYPYLYVSELTGRIRGINLTDNTNVILLAGPNTTTYGYANGKGLGDHNQAQFNEPIALALMPAEYDGAMDAKLYIADYRNNAIRVMYEGGSFDSWYTWPGASVGDDPTFVGADRLPYEVRGEPWRYFNLISAPRLSLNAQFLPVPEGYVHGKITDTVLGTLHLAVCEPDTGRVVGMLFDVFSGELRCMRSPPPDAVGRPLPTPCVEAMGAAAATMSEEVAVCFLSSMRCAYTYPTELEALKAVDRARLAMPRTPPSLSTPPAQPLSLHQPSAPRSPVPCAASMVRLHMGRLNVSVGGTATLSLMRDVIDRPQSPLQGGSNGTVEAHGAGGTTRGVDCSPLSLWVRALHACETWHAVVRGDEPLDAWQGLPAEERVATLAYLTGGNASQQMHFHNVRIDELLHAAQSDVHGLLGQRSIRPAPMAPQEGQRQVRSASSAADARSEERSELAELAASTIMATTGSDGSVGGVGTTRRAVVGADGRHQGEGAIEGTYGDYRVQQIGSHGPGAFLYSRFNCPAPAAAAAAA